MGRIREMGVVFVLVLVLVLFGQACAEERLPEQKIDVLDLRDMDIKDVLKFIAQRSGLNIVAGDMLQGRVSVYLEKIDAREALATILEANHLAYEERAGLIRVITSEEYQNRYGRPFSQKMVTHLIHMKGIQATAASALLEKMRTPAGKIIADDASATVFIEDTEARVAQMVHYIDDIDQETVQRVFEPRFIDAEMAAVRMAEIVTPQVGRVRQDARANKIFMTDTAAKIEEAEALLRAVDVPQMPSVISLSYAKADEVAAAIKNFLTPEQGAVEVDQRSNQIIITDIPSRLWALEAMVRQLDRRDKEVLIEARIVQVVLKDEFRMGIDWEAVMNQAAGLKFSSVWGGTGTGGKSSLAVGTLSDDNYRAVLEALGSVNQSHVLSSPRVAVLNHREARILVGTTRPYVTTTTTTPSTGPVTVSEDIKFIDVGVKLVVTPAIHEDGYVTMKLRPEVSSAAASLRTGQNNVIPIVDTSEVETTVRVKDGVTIMIGGLIKEEKSEAVSGVPILKSLPVVGSVFRNQSQGQEKTEIVIFLTPRIISGDLGRREEPDFDLGRPAPML